MKKFLLAFLIACFSALTASAQYTSTTNLGFEKPQIGVTQNWGTYINSDFDSLDAYVSGSITLQYSIDSGLVNAMVACPTQTLPSLKPGMVIAVLPLHTNTSTTPTLNECGFGAHTIIKQTSDPLVAGDIGTLIAVLLWDGTYWELQNPQSTVDVGTPNEIDLINGAVALDPAIINPGTQVGQNINNVWHVDGFTTSLFPGIGVAQTAWTSGTYPLCTAVSYSGGNYIAVGVTTGITPGTNAAIWWQVQNAYTPTQTDCAYYYVLAQATNANASDSDILEFGRSRYSTPYMVNIGLVGATSQVQVSLRGADRGFNQQFTYVKAGEPISYILSTPDQSGSAPYNFSLENISFDGGGLVTGGCVSILGNKVDLIQHVGCTNWNQSSGSALPILIGGSHFNTYQALINDVFVQGNGGNSLATITVSGSGTGPSLSFTVSSGGSYKLVPSQLWLIGFSAGQLPCSSMPTSYTITTSGSGPYVITGVTAVGGSGCAGPYIVQVPDIGAEVAGIEFQNLTDSTMEHLVVNDAGETYGIFYNGGSSNVVTHEHVYGGSKYLVSDYYKDTHIGEELDSALDVGALTGGGATWIGTTLTTQSAVAPNSGVLEFEQRAASPAAFNIINATCPNSSTSGNTFSLAANANGPVPHGGFGSGSIFVVNGMECDTLVAENSLGGPVNVFSPINAGGSGIAIGTAGDTFGESVMLSQSGTFGHFYVNVQTIDNSTDTYNFGIYNSVGTLICSTGNLIGSTYFTTTGYKSLAFASSCSLQAGQQYTIAFVANTANTLHLLEGGTAGTLSAVYGQLSTSAMPSTITPPSISYVLVSATDIWFVLVP